MAYREFTASDGREWRVWDTYPAAKVPRGVASPMVHGWVTFEHGTERRRLAPPPQGWEVATDEQLRDWLAAAGRIVRVDTTTPPSPAPDLADDAADGALVDPGPTRQPSTLNVGTQSIIDQSRRTLEKMRVAIEESEERNPDLPSG